MLQNGFRKGVHLFGASFHFAQKIEIPVSGQNAYPQDALGTVPIVLPRNPCIPEEVSRVARTFASTRLVLILN